MKINVKDIPNILTILRIISIPLFFVAFYSNWKLSGLIAAGVFAFASLTDFFDGYLARALCAQSQFGRLFDPIADKMMIATALLILADVNLISGTSIIPAAIILCREIFISGLREYMSKSGKTIKVSSAGKLKTVVQIVSVFLFLIGDDSYIIFAAKSMLWLSAFLSLISAYQYWFCFVAKK